MFEHGFFEFHATIHATEIKKRLLPKQQSKPGSVKRILPSFLLLFGFLFVYEIVEIQPSFLFVSVYLVVYQTQSIGYSHPPL